MARRPQEVEEPEDPLNPIDNEPSDLDDLTHAEFLAIYKDASINIRFAKEQQWRTVLYFMVGAIAATVFEIMTRWSDKQLAMFLLVIIWIFSIVSVIVIVCLQWWQGAEHRKIEFLTSKWSTFSNAARGRKSSILSDVQRYFMLGSMILFLELVTIAVTRIFLSII